MIVEITYASSPSSDLLTPTLEFNNEEAGLIRLAKQKSHIAWLFIH